MTYWTHAVDDVLIFRPRRAPQGWSLIGQLCTVIALADFMYLPSGERVPSLGGVYEIAFESGEVFHAWEHDLLALGARRWMH
ncbi:hypothetical protein [Paraburkholderia sp. C35]|uniref:hypothetical protein n=1 Tax=Paraburkholderia sp. C35 TaxID=2126993 RepID=UPI000D686BE7|nr:hypothetical protein [Paraburkholderia sp. C35]